MQVENKLTPSEEQIKGFFEPDDGGPIYMVNLLKYRDCLLYTSPSPRDKRQSRMPSSA